MEISRRSSSVSSLNKENDDDDVFDDNAGTARLKKQIYINNFFFLFYLKGGENDKIAANELDKEYDFIVFDDAGKLLEIMISLFQH